MNNYMKVILSAVKTYIDKMAARFNNKVNEIDDKVNGIDEKIPTKVSQLENDESYATEEYVVNNSGKVKTINGIEPDESGNIEVNTFYHPLPYTIETIKNDEYKLVSHVLNVNMEELEDDIEYKLIMPKFEKVDDEYEDLGVIVMGYILCDDSTKKEVVLNTTGATRISHMYKTDTKKVFNIGNTNDINTLITIDYSDKSSSSAVKITVNYNHQYIEIGNNIEYTPTTDYSPATKKYVDDTVNGIKIPEGFSGSWNDLEDKPFYEEISEEVYLEETTVEIGSDLYTQVSNTLYFTEGDTYLVTYNGTEYECIAYASVYMNAPTILIGNASLLGLTGGNNEPFLFDSYNDIASMGTYFNVSTTGTYTISITHCNSVVHKINDKFVNATGQKVSGNIYIIDGESKIADVGAEIFNDYISNINTGAYSHVEGFNNTNTGDYSHIENTQNVCNGYYSHVEGRFNKVKDTGTANHVEGYNNIVSGASQHVQGRANIEDVEHKYAHIVGNGWTQISTSTNQVVNEIRSNAHTLDWDGNAWYSGDIYVGSTSGTNKDDGSKKLATEDYVITELNNYYLKSEADTLHTEIEDYVDTQVAALVNAAPETLDTLGELAEAFNENKEVVEALDEAISKKANQSDLTSLQNTVSSHTTTINALKTETWTFTLNDGSTVTKKVAILS